MDALIQTPRFFLRSFVEADAPALFEMDSDPAVHKYLGNRPMTKPEQAVAAILHIKKQYLENGMGRMAVIEKESGDFVGWSGLKLEKEIRDFEYYDLGYRFKQKYWGRGIATETGIASLRFGFEQLELSEICGAAMLENWASNRVLTRCGLEYKGDFEFEGSKCHWYKISRSAWMAKNL